MLTPFWIGLHWLLLASTWTQDKVTWAGIRYRIRGVNKTQILSRPANVEKLPAGTPGLAMLGALHDRRRRSYTRPIAPVHGGVGIEEPVTFTVAVDESAEVEATTIESIESPAPINAPFVRALLVPVPHPGGPSAVIPLTTTLYDRSLRYREIAKASDRGAASAIEAALTKTRIRTSFRYPVRSLPDKGSRTTAENPPRHPFVPGGIATALSNVEIVLTKTRLEGAVPQAKFRAFHAPDGTVRNRARAALVKTRVRPAVAHSVPVIRPADSSALSSPATAQPSSVPAPARALGTVKTRSFAARRANAAGAGSLKAGPASPALSSRAPQASKAADARPGSRPGNRRPSGRH